MLGAILAFFLCPTHHLRQLCALLPHWAGRLQAYRASLLGFGADTGSRCRLPPLLTLVSTAAPHSPAPTPNTSK